MARAIRSVEPPDISRLDSDVKEHTLTRKGITLAVAGACLFSTKPIIIKFTYAYPIDAVTLMTLRMAFSLPFYLVFAILALRERSRKGLTTELSITTLTKTALIGILGYYVASYLDLEGLTMVTAQFERLILFTYPSFVILLGALLFGQKITARIITALFVTYAGLAILFGQDLRLFGNEVMIGAAYVFGASLTFAGYILFSKTQINKIGARLFTCFAMIAASLSILAHFAITHDLAMLAQPLPVYGLTFMIAVLSTVLPSFLIATAIEEIGSTPTALLGSIGPVFTTLLGIFLLGEIFTTWHFIGMVLVISGALILSQKRRGI